MEATGAHPDDHSDRRRKRFRPLQAVRKFFRSNRKSVQPEKSASVKTRSHGELRVNDDDDDDDEGGFKQASRLSNPCSTSEDSIFVEPKDSKRLKKSAVSIEGINKTGIQNELLSKLKKRRSLNSDDDGLPVSPGSSFTTADIIMGQALKASPSKSASRDSDRSLLSIDGSENEEEDLFRRTWTSSVASVIHKDEVNLRRSQEVIVDLGDIEGSTSNLNLSLAKHRIAVQPQHRRLPQRALRQQRVSLASGLPQLKEESPGRIHHKVLPPIKRKTSVDPKPDSTTQSSEPKSLVSSPEHTTIGTTKEKRLSASEDTSKTPTVDTTATESKKTASLPDQVARDFENVSKKTDLETTESLVNKSPTSPDTENENCHDDALTTEKDSESKNMPSHPAVAGGVTSPTHAVPSTSELAKVVDRIKHVDDNDTVKETMTSLRKDDVVMDDGDDMDGYSVDCKTMEFTVEDITDILSVDSSDQKVKDEKLAEKSDGETKNASSRKNLYDNVVKVGSSYSVSKVENSQTDYTATTKSNIDKSDGTTRAENRLSDIFSKFESKAEKKEYNTTDVASKLENKQENKEKDQTSDIASKLESKLESKGKSQTCDAASNFGTKEVVKTSGVSSKFESKVESKGKGLTSDIASKFENKQESKQENKSSITLSKSKSDTKASGLGSKCESTGGIASRFETKSDVTSRLVVNKEVESNASKKDDKSDVSDTKKSFTLPVSSSVDKQRPIRRKTLPDDTGLKETSAGVESAKAKISEFERKASIPDNNLTLSSSPSPKDEEKQSSSPVSDKSTAPSWIALAKKKRAEREEQGSPEEGRDKPSSNSDMGRTEKFTLANLRKFSADKMENNDSVKQNSSNSSGQKTEILQDKNVKNLAAKPSDVKATETKLIKQKSEIRGKVVPTEELEVQMKSKSLSRGLSLQTEEKPVPLARKPALPSNKPKLSPVDIARSPVASKKTPEMEIKKLPVWEKKGLSLDRKKPLASPEEKTVAVDVKKGSLDGKITVQHKTSEDAKSSAEISKSGGVDSKTPSDEGKNVLEQKKSPVLKSHSQKNLSPKSEKKDVALEQNKSPISVSQSQLSKSPFGVRRFGKADVKVDENVDISQRKLMATKSGPTLGKSEPKITDDDVKVPAWRSNLKKNTGVSSGVDMSERKMEIVGKPAKPAVDLSKKPDVSVTSKKIDRIPLNNNNKPETKSSDVKTKDHLVTRKEDSEIEKPLILREKKKVELTYSDAASRKSKVLDMVKSYQNLQVS